MSGWRAALLALAVGGAVLLTGFVVGRPADPGTGPSTPTTDSDPGGLVLACPDALRSPCMGAAQALGLTFQPYRPGDPIPDRTVVLAPAADLPDGVTPGPVVGRSPVVISIWRERAQRLASSCGTIDGACLGSALGAEWTELGGPEAWGPFKLGLADPTTGEADLLAFSVAAGLAEPAALAGSLRLVADTDARLIADWVLFGDSRADAVVSTEVAVAGQFENAVGRGGRLEIFYLATGPWVEYVAVGEGRGSGGLVDELQGPEAMAAFAAGGLRPASGEPGGLPEGLGSPGSVTSAPDDATRAKLIDQWNSIR